MMKLSPRNKNLGKKKMIIDDDEDEEEEDNVNDENMESSLSEEPVDNNDENSDSDGDLNQKSPGREDRESKAEKSPKSPGSSQDKDDGQEPGTSQHTEEVGSLQLSFQNDDLYEADSGDEKQADSSPTSPFPTIDDDLPNDSDEGGKEDEEDSDRESASDKEGNEDDEGFDESQLDASLLAQLKKMKGAAKSSKEREKYERKSKPSAEKMLELYSESQRLQRESRINLPYHEPEAKSLDDFLARAEKKKQEYAALKRPKDIQKAQIIFEKLSVKPPSLSPSQRHKKHSARSSLSQPTPSKSSSEVPSNKSVMEDSGIQSQDALTQSQNALSQSQTSTVILPASQSGEGDMEDLGDGELPDLVPSHLNAAINEAVLASQSCSDNIMKSQAEEMESTLTDKERDCSTDHENLATGGFEGGSCNNDMSENESNRAEKGIDLSNIQSDVEVPSLRRDQSVDLFKSQSTVGEPDIPSSPPVQSEVPSLQKDPSTDLFQSQGVDSEIRQDAGQNSHPVEKPNVFIVQETPEEDIFSSFHSSQMTQNKSEESTAKDKPDITEQEQSKNDESINEESEKIPVEESSKKTPSKKSLLEKLKGMDLPELPGLSRTPDDMICLDEDVEKGDACTPKNPGVRQLMDRLARHSKKRAPKPGYDVDISIVEKEGEEGDKKELKLKSFTYHVEEEEKPVSDANSGSKLMLLKQQLDLGMRKKRAEARERRQKLYALENEEGFEGATTEEKMLEDEEEAEMTDRSDTDDDGDEVEDEEEFQLQFGQHDDESDDGKDYNPLLDTEAKDDEEEEEYSDFEEDSNDVHLHFDVSDEEGDDERDEEDEDKETTAKTSTKKKKKPKFVDLSDGEEGDFLESLERGSSTPTKEQTASLDLWADEMTPMTKLLQDSQTQDRHKFRRENSRSPDLYSTGQPEESESNSTRTLDQHNESSVGSFNPHSQMLDADGYLKLTPTQRPRQSRLSILAQDNAVDSSSMSGFESSLKMTPGGIFENGGTQLGGGDNNMKDLMGLCSGTFGQDSISEDAFLISQNNRTQGFNPTAGGGTEDNSRDSFHILSDVEDEGTQRKQKRVRRVLSDSEDEKVDEDKDEEERDEEEDREADTDVEENSDDDNASDKPLKFTGFKDKKKGMRKEFLDVEAELSGSEAESDEDLDLAEEDDILEEEEGDKDMAGVSEEALREQVGKVHMKQLQDADDRELMRYKEMYLQDGDLYSEGGGRLRNFRWKDMDDGSQQDMFADNSDHEEGEEDQEDAQWRKARYEREKFLEDADQNVAPGEDSQLLKLGHFMLKKKDSTSSQVNPQAASGPEHPAKHKMSKKGSFLSRGKDALVRLAKVAKATLGGNAGGKSQNFVFQTVESQSEEQPEKEPDMPQPLQPAKRKAHKPPQPAQAVKKQKMDNTPSKPLIARQNSIFNLLDK